MCYTSSTNFVLTSGSTIYLVFLKSERPPTLSLIQVPWNQSKKWMLSKQALLKVRNHWLCIFIHCLKTFTPTANNRLIKLKLPWESKWFWPDPCTFHFTLINQYFSTALCLSSCRLPVVSLPNCCCLCQLDSGFSFLFAGTCFKAWAQLQNTLSINRLQQRLLFAMHHVVFPGAGFCPNVHFWWASWIGLKAINRYVSHLATTSIFLQTIICPRFD